MSEKKRSRKSSAADGAGAEGSAPNINGFVLVRVKLSLLPFERILYVKVHRAKKGDDLPGKWSFSLQTVHTQHFRPKLFIQDLIQPSEPLEIKTSVSLSPGDRTLFVANAEMGEQELQRVFATFGEVERINLQMGDDKQPGIRAHVIFSSKSSIKAVLSHTGVVKEADTSVSEGSELRSWVDGHRSKLVPDSELQAKVDAYMQYFDERTEAEKRARKDRTVDEDGFEVVTYKKKAAPAPTGEEIPPKKKKKELQDFYSFQVREKKREALVSLRNKFEADKKRVEAMKANRQFKPF